MAVSDDLIRQKYGYMAWALAVPELNELLQWIADSEPTDSQIQARFESTGWWQQHQQTDRAWTQLQNQDPASANAKISQQSLTIQLEAQKLGITLGDAQLKEMAINSIRFGWDSDQLKAALGGVLAQQPAGQAKGDVLGTYQKLQSMAASYMVGVDDRVLNDWAKKITMGKLGEPDAIKYFEELATGRFPNLQAQIKAGITPQQFFQPYAQQASQILEKPIDTNDLMNKPKFQQMIDYVDPQGNRRPMTLAEAGTYMRGLDDWRYTQGAHDQASSMAATVLKDFGALA